MKTRRIIGYGILTAAAASFGLNLFAKRINSKKENKFKDANEDEGFRRDHNGIPTIMTKK